MKILHVITSLYTGGAEKLMVDLLPRLAQSGCEIELCVFNGEVTPFKTQLEEAGIKIHSFTSGSVYNPLHILRLIRLIRRGEYDIVHTHNTAPQFFAAIAKVLCSVVLCTTEHNTSNRRRGSRWYAPIDKWMYRRYKNVIACSEQVKYNLYHSGLVNSEKIITINNGVPIERFSNAVPLPEIRNSIHYNSRIITMVAGFRWEKDQDTLIRALKYLPKNFFLFLVGDGIRRSELEQLALSENVSDQVRFLGIRKDVPNILHSSDYIVMSSHFEGLSLSSVEGMCVGKPMLASDVDGLKQVIEGAGIMFKHADVKDFVAKILMLEEDKDLYQATAEKCFKRAQQFDISQMTNGYLSVYKELLTP
ncbi:glycosyltransferase [uncultured Duncaniella sp.]|uniref:glycosyltransferase n=1 Tax=uncultured Duncaniella sp. TaxID=2768039 RepID=UPI0025B0CB79|nr:glycosyltransferase [uncultured Duncaniella sp.]